MIYHLFFVSQTIGECREECYPKLGAAFKIGNIDVTSRNST